VVSDLGAVSGPPAYTSTTPIATAAEPGGTGSRRLLLTATDSSTPHYALVTNGAANPSSAVLNAAKAELTAWAATHG
jgi:hypothetical protein